MVGGDTCVALVPFLCTRSPSRQGDASVPTPHPHHSRPYGNHGTNMEDEYRFVPPHIHTTPAPTGTPPSFLVFLVLFSSLDAHNVYPLTPPAVSPPIRYLWNTMYKITTGTALTTAAPINWPYRGNAPPS